MIIFFVDEPELTQEDIDVLVHRAARKRPQVALPFDDYQMDAHAMNVHTCKAVRGIKPADRIVI